MGLSEITYLVDAVNCLQEGLRKLIYDGIFPYKVFHNIIVE